MTHAIMGEGRITIVISGEPVAKGRARFCKSGYMYTPERTRTWETHSKTIAGIAMDGKPPLTCPIGLYVVAVLPVPQSWSKAKRQAALDKRRLPTGRPDVDNYLKAVMDSFNKVVWEDDSQVVYVKCLKIYGTETRVIVIVTPLAEAPIEDIYHAEQEDGEPLP